MKSCVVSETVKTLLLVILIRKTHRPFMQIKEKLKKSTFIQIKQIFKV